MAFVSFEDAPLSVQLISTSDLSDKTFNPSDYIDLTPSLKVEMEALSPNLATVGTPSQKVQGGNFSRVMSDKVDRVTGEVIDPKPEFKKREISCLKFQKNDILLHKYAARIGRIGISDSTGLADSHFLVIRALRINSHYLLLALRNPSVLTQLPYRETARPGVWKEDIEKLRIPRLDNPMREEELGTFIQDMFTLRKRARMALIGFVKNFNEAIHPALPEGETFLVSFDLLDCWTFVPGRYRVEAIQSGYANYEVLGKKFEVVEPPYVLAGNQVRVLTNSDFRPEGIMPENLKDSLSVKGKNYVKVGDVLLNRMESSKEQPFKATVVMPSIDYLKSMGLADIQGTGNSVTFPVYEHILYLRRKEGEATKITPSYLALVLNSELMTRLINAIRVGSTGLAYIPQTILRQFRVPLFDENIQFGFSKGEEICLGVLSETLGMLVRLTVKFNQVLDGLPAEELSVLISQERETLNILGAPMLEAEKHCRSTKKAFVKLVTT